MSDITKYLEQLRENILEKNMTRRNDLINKAHGSRTGNLIRIVNEDPNFVFKSLVKDRKRFQLKYLPEQSNKVINEISDDGIQSLLSEELITLNEETNKYELIVDHIDKKKWAKLFGIKPEFEVPRLDGNLDETHTDDELQTLFFQNELTKKNLSIKRRARTDDRDKGIKSLYIVIGFLEWIDKDDKKNLSPLVLVPLSIELNKLRDATISCINDDIETNLVLKKKLERIDSPITLPVLETNTDDFDIEQYFDDIENIIENKDGWSIKRFISIGIFNLTGIEFYNDLDPMSWESGLLEENPFLQQIVDTSERESINPSIQNEFDIDNAEKETRLRTVLEADPSQYKAILRAHEGKNIVISGPPGTGKSQTISNIVSQLIFDDKTVLIVSEKAVALEVVKRNLDGVGLGQLCFSLTGKPAEMVRDLKIRNDQKKPRNRQQVNRLQSRIDENNTERGMLTERLNRHAELMRTDLDGHNISYFEILTTAGGLRKILTESGIHLNQLDEIARSIDMDRESYTRQLYNLNEFNELGKILSEYEEIKNHPWFGWTNITDIALDRNDQSRLSDYIQSQKELINSLQEIGHEPQSKGNDLKIIDSYKELKSKMLGKDVSEVNLDLAKIFTIMPIEELRLVADVYKNQYLKNKPTIESSFSDITKIDGSHLDSISIIEEINPKLSREIKSKRKKDVKKAIEEFKKLSQRYIRDLSHIETLANNLEIENFRDKDNFRLLKRISSFFLIDRGFTPSERNTLFHNKLLDNEIITLESSIDSLKSGDSELKQFINKEIFDYKIAIQHQAVLNTQNIWSKMFWNSEYREAKKYLNKCTSTSAKLKFAERLHNFNQYIQIQRSINEINEDSHFKDLFGEYFNGLRTDIEKIKNIRSLYREVDESFSGTFSSFGKKILSMNTEELINMSSQVDADTNDLVHSIYDSVKNFFTLSRLTPVEIENLFSEESINEINGFLDQLNMALSELQDSISINEIQSITPALTEYIESTEYIEKNIDKQYLSTLSNQENEQFAIIEKAILVSDCFIESGLSDLNVISNDQTAEAILERFSSIDALHKSIGIFENKKEIFYLHGGIDEYGWHENDGGNFYLQDELRKCEKAIDAPEELDNWVKYLRVSKNLDSEPSRELKVLFEDGIITLDQLKICLKYIYFTSLAKKVLVENSGANDFDPDLHEEDRKKFREVDKQYIKILPETVLERANRKSLPGGRNAPRVMEKTEMVYLEHEFQKKKRHYGPRTMMRQASKAIGALKPCLMMRPTDVAKYLSKGQLFDVVIMDEASQISPDKAIGSMLRAKQFILAGDTNQLPPSDFFDSKLNEDELDEIDFGESSESVLEMGEKIVPNSNQLLLNWHYRSEHHSLISFSNHYFYEDKLRIFRSPQEQNQDRGVTHRFIENAVLENRKNTEEAEIVVKEVMDHMKNKKSESLMVVAMNVTQKDEIQRVYDSMLQESENSFMREYESLWESSEKKEIFDIKNLENVQGDERDVVFISYTYAKNPEGIVRQNFRFAGATGAWRAFNVLFTRAKKRMRVFASIKPSDVRVDDRTALGKRAFRDFLEFSETGMIRGIMNVRGDADNEFEESIGRAIGNLGYKVDFQVGFEGFFIDMAIKNPNDEGEYLLGIEADGATYHSSPSARSRDRYRQEILEMRGWNIHRVWSTNWFTNPDEEIRKIVDRIEAELSILGESDIAISQSTATQSEVIESIEEDRENVYLRTRETTKDFLINFRENQIIPNFPDRENGILRDASMNALIHYLPTTRDEYLERIDVYVRGDTDSQQSEQYLDTILEILETCDPSS